LFSAWLEQQLPEVQPLNITFICFNTILTTIYFIRAHRLRPTCEHTAHGHMQRSRPHTWPSGPRMAVAIGQSCASRRRRRRRAAAAEECRHAEWGKRPISSGNPPRITAESLCSVVVVSCGGVWGSGLGTGAGNGPQMWRIWLIGHQGYKLEGRWRER